MRHRVDRSPRAADSGTWRLGDHSVHRLGFGAMRLTGTEAFHGGVPRDRGASIAVVRRAIELGVNHVDTAAFYFSSLRSANEIINAALAPFGDEVLVATKVGPRRDRGGDWSDAARPDQLRGDVEENLRLLGRDHLDLVRTVARAHGATPEQIRLAWTLAQGAHVLAIPGTGDPAHLRANVAAGAIRLTPADLTMLEQAA